MSDPAMISPAQPHGQVQRRTYVQIRSIVPRSTVLRGAPKRVVMTSVSTTIVGMLPTAAPV
jgi:hypothetical protein